MAHRRDLLAASLLGAALGTGAASAQGSSGGAAQGSGGASSAPAATPLPTNSTDDSARIRSSG